MDTQFNNLMRKIGALQASVGLKTITKYRPVFEPEKINLSVLLSSLKKTGIESSVELDVDFYTTSWDNWQLILDDVWGIIKNFNWIADTADCDNRSALTTVLCGLLFGVNTCSGVYCDRYNLDGGWSGRHWANLITDKDGNTYLYDSDNHGLRQKVSNNDIIMGREKYHFISARTY